ncbi:hypothetical protein E0V51_23000 [Salmonella enterica subsp. enterica serovar Hvittingfoss]|nr:hypothetical protein [Salmonella enterica subsp. enterica serovar Hvittingfoss]
MKKLVLGVIASAALLGGCVSQNQGVEMQNRLNDQQKQINTLSVRLQSDEYRLNKAESHIQGDLTQSKGYCYLNGTKYSPGFVYAGHICDAQTGTAMWRVYTHR